MANVRTVIANKTEENDEHLYNKACPPLTEEFTVKIVIQINNIITEDQDKPNIRLN